MTPTKNQKSFGETVRELRIKKEIGLRKFAEMIGVSPTYLSQVERDEFLPPSEEKIKLIAKELDQNPDELLALADKVSSDLSEIIREHPKEMATFLRTAKSLSADKIEELTKKAKDLKK